jgi:Glycosyl hydrolases family 38 C-terminal domain
MSRTGSRPKSRAGPQRCSGGVLIASGSRNFARARISAERSCPRPGRQSPCPSSKTSPSTRAPGRSTPIYAGARDLDTLESVKVRESGPERGVVELRWKIGERSRVVQQMRLYARSPRIDFVTDLEWQERLSLLKVGFPTGIRNRRATCEIQFGSIDRPTHRNMSWEEAAFEVPAQRWADLSDAHHGVALLADCKPSHQVREDTLWLSLLKGAIDPDPDADRGPAPLHLQPSAARGGSARSPTRRVQPHRCWGEAKPLTPVHARPILTRKTSPILASSWKLPSGRRTRTP